MVRKKKILTPEEELAKRRKQAFNRKDSIKSYIPSTYYTGEGKERVKAVKLIKRPLEGKALPYTRKIKNYSISLQKVPYSLYDEELSDEYDEVTREVFEVSKYDDGNLIYQKSYKKFDDALKDYRHVILRTIRLMQKVKKRNKRQLK